jgi:hypothetical protein
MRTSDVLLWAESLPRLPHIPASADREAPWSVHLYAPLQQLGRIRLDHSMELCETLVIGV